MVAYPVYPAHAAYVPPPADLLAKYAKYGSAHFAIKIASYPVGSLAATFAIKTADVPGWNPNALVDKIVEGPPGLQGKWVVKKAVAGFGPERFSTMTNIVKAVEKTSTAKYSSRTEFEMKNHQVVLVKICTRKVVD